MGAGIYALRGEPVASDAPGGTDCGEEESKEVRPKPYEQMERPGERVQIDVKVVPRSCIAAPGLKLYQYTAIDEYSRYRVLEAYEEQSPYSSADFLRKVVAAFKRRGITVECVQTDNGFEFTNRFANSRRELPTLFEAEAARLGIRHKQIRPYTPRHNGKVERSHREAMPPTASGRSTTLAGSWLPKSEQRPPHAPSGLALPSPNTFFL